MTSEQEKQNQAVHHAFKVALSMTLFYWFILSQDWALTIYGAYAIIFCSLDTSGASIEKGMMRLVGTTVGIAVSFVLIAAFGQDRELMLMSLAIYLIAIAYGMQGSRHSYGWYVGGFVPLVVWGNSYPEFVITWDFAAYRWLETAVGILVYTVVEILLWPQTSGKKLKRSGTEIWSSLSVLFRGYQHFLTDGWQDRQSVPSTGDAQPSELRSKLIDLRTKLANSRTRALDDWQQSLIDTPAVHDYQAQWNALRDNVNQLVRHVDLWGQSSVDCRSLPLDSLVLGLGEALDSVSRKLAHIELLWQETLLDNIPVQEQTDALSDAQPSVTLQMDATSVAKLTTSERAALGNFVYQLEVLQADAERTIRNLRIITGKLPASELTAAIADEDQFSVYRARTWSPDRLIMSLFPAMALLSGALFWIYFCPPTGTGQVHMPGTLGLMVLREKLNPVAMMMAVVFLIIFPMMPIVWVLLPALQTPEELLALIFIFSFVSAWLGSKVSALKAILLVLFATLTGISNQQHFSFEMSTDAALLYLICAPLLGFCWFVLTPLHAEDKLLQKLQLFYTGCARVLDGFFDHTSKVRKRNIEALILPAAEELRLLREQLRPELSSSDSDDGSGETDLHRMDRLVDAVDSLSNGLIAVQEAHRQATNVIAIPPSIAELGRRIQNESQRFFYSWSQLKPAADRESIQTLIGELERSINALELPQNNSASTSSAAVTSAAVSSAAVGDRQQASERALHVLLGSLRGLADAIAKVDQTVARINWSQITAARF